MRLGVSIPHLSLEEQVDDSNTSDGHSDAADILEGDDLELNENSEFAHPTSPSNPGIRNPGIRQEAEPLLVRSFLKIRFSS